MKEAIIKLTSDHIKVKDGEYVQDFVRCQDCKYLEVHGKTTMHYWCDQWEHYTDTAISIRFIRQKERRKNVTLHRCRCADSKSVSR